MNSRFEELFRKYRENTLKEQEFREFTKMLEDPLYFRALERNLVKDWQGEGVPETARPVAGRFIIFRRRRLLKIAACFLVLVAAGAFYFKSQLPGGLYTIYRTDFSETLEVELPDGSKVTMNANSELKWSNKWKKEEARKVILEGEAFFDIRHLEGGVPFTVSAGGLSVEVTGTSFNVNNRDEQVEVYLDEGKVNLRTGNGSIAMAPGEKVQYDAVQKKVEKSEHESMVSAASWKNGVLNFRDMKFRDVLTELRNIYGKSFHCRDEQLLGKTIYLGVPYSNWETVKQALELSLDIRITETGDRAEITSD